MWIHLLRETRIEWRLRELARIPASERGLDAHYEKPAASLYDFCLFRKLFQ